MKVVEDGVVIGLLIALVLLFGVGAADALTLVAVSVPMLAIALVACVVPARRAIGVEPAVVLRNE